MENVRKPNDYAYAVARNLRDASASRWVASYKALSDRIQWLLISTQQTATSVSYCLDLQLIPWPTFTLTLVVTTNRYRFSLYLLRTH